MLSGYPFRMAQATQQSLGTFLTLIENMRQVPHPQAPDLPLLADPKLDLTPYIYRALDFLKRELTYAGQYSDATGTSDPAGLDPIERARADAGLPISSGPERPTFVPDSFGSAAGGTGQLPTDGSRPRRPTHGSRRSSDSATAERDAELPTAGSLLNADPTGSAYAGRGMAGFGSGCSTKRLLPYRGCRPQFPKQRRRIPSPTQAPSYSSEQTAPAATSISQASATKVLKFWQHFGLEAPALLNRYSCVVEDALLAQAQQTAESCNKLSNCPGHGDAQKVIDAAAEDNAAYHVMLTNPDMLAAYVERLLRSRRSLSD